MVSALAIRLPPDAACGGPLTLLGQFCGRGKFQMHGLSCICPANVAKACSKPAGKLALNRPFGYTEPTDSEQRSYPI
jgi:hypothetical protein